MANDSHPSAWEMKAGGSKLRDTLCYIANGGQCGRQESLLQTNKQSQGWEQSYCVLFLQREKDSGLSSVHCLSLFTNVLVKPYLFWLGYTSVDVKGRLGGPFLLILRSILNQLSQGTPTRTAGEWSCLCGWRSSPPACVLRLAGAEPHRRRGWQL